MKGFDNMGEDGHGTRLIVFEKETGIDSRTLLAHGIVDIQQTGKCLFQGKAYHSRTLGIGARGKVQGAECLLHSADNDRAGVGKRTIEIEDNGHSG